MTNDKWITIAAACGVVGGVAWLGKLAVIAAQGAEGGLDLPLFFVGLALLLLAATGLGAHLSRGRPTRVRAAAILLTPVAAVAAFLGVQTVTESLTGLVPALDGEYGIVLAALLGIVLGGRRLLAARGRAPATAQP
jgi:hypothetical protein